MTDRQFDHALPVALAFCAGFIEAITFTGLYHTFVTFITGTLMVMVIDLVTGEAGALNKAVVVAAFFVFSVVWLFLSRGVRHGRGERRWLFLGAEGIAILVFALLASLLAPHLSAGSSATLIVSVAAIVAMSLHSVMFFTMLGGSAASHFMTGNLTQFCRGLVDQIAPVGDTPPSAEDRAATAHRVRHFPLVIASFVAGVASGVSLFVAFSFVVLAIPGLIVLLCAALARSAWAKPA